MRMLALIGLLMWGGLSLVPVLSDGPEPPPLCYPMPCQATPASSSHTTLVH
jgi:hypothetical protein